jgi:hypothetical protein
MCSQAWKLRSDALACVAAQLEGRAPSTAPRGKAVSDVVRAFGPLLLRLVGDKNALVSVAAMPVRSHMPFCPQYVVNPINSMK